MTESHPEKKIIVIPAKNESPQEQAKKRNLRVAAYCRVSTGDEEQLTSYENQKAFYTEKIMKNPEWTMVDVFADEGITGTSTCRRKDFLRMIRQCRQGKIDMILAKSVSRFARNTLDTISYTRELRSLGIAVIFEEQNINSIYPESEFLIALHAAFAQSESESISANVRWGKRQSIKDGKVTFQYKTLLGYEKGPDGNPVIIPEEAETVRRIFEWYLAGKSVRDIRLALVAGGFRNAVGTTDWTTSNLRSILTNEKYTGDSLWQKTYTSDTLPATRHKNTGEHEQYYAVGTHPPIIPRKTFDQVQTLMQKRSVGQAVTHGRLCVRMRCSCGSRIRAKQVNGRWYWCCCRHDEKGDCAIKPVPERRRMKPSAASIINSSIRVSPFWSRCWKPSGRSVIADCSGARTSFPSTKKYLNSPVRIKRWPFSSKTASLILTFLYPKATS